MREEVVNSTDGGPMTRDNPLIPSLLGAISSHLGWSHGPQTGDSG